MPSATLTALKLGSSFLGRKLYSLMGIFIGRWRISVTILFVFLLFAHAIGQVIIEKSPMPLVDEVGVKLLQIDNSLYDTFIEFENNNRQIPIDISDMSFFRAGYEVGVYYLHVISGLWFIYAFIYVVYWFFAESMFAKNTSARAAHWAMALTVYILFQVVAGVYVFIQDYDTMQGTTPFERTKFFFNTINPVKGLYKTIINAPYIINPIIERNEILMENFMPQKG